MSLHLFLPFYRHRSTIHFPHFFTTVTFPPTNAECQRTSAVGFWPAWELYVDEEADREQEQHEEGKRMGCKRAGGRQNEGENVLSYKSEVQQRHFFQGQIHLEAPRQENASFLCYSVSDDWQLISPSEWNAVVLIHQGCLNPVLQWLQTSRPFHVQTPLHYNARIPLSK